MAALVRLLIVLVLLLAALAPRVESATIHVPADQPTIQAGIDATVAGDTVLVAPGTYTGAGNRDLDFHGRDIVLRSEGGPQVTLIIADGDYPGIYLHSGETNATIIEGLGITSSVQPDQEHSRGIVCDPASPTIVNCRIYGFWCRGPGAGVYLNGSPARIVNCTIEACSSYHHDAAGGGIYAVGDVYITRSRIVDNQVQYHSGEPSGLRPPWGTGGGVAVGGRLTMEDCSIIGNVAFATDVDESSVRGGGIYAGGAHLVRCIIESNAVRAERADNFGFRRADGGGADLGPNAVLKNCVFRGNTCVAISGAGMGSNDAHGGGLSCTSASLVRCTFEGNTVYADGGVGFNVAAGGGLFGGSVHMTECIFSRNSALAPDANDQALGGAISIGAGGRLDRCTLAFNSALTSGTGIHLSGRGTTIENTIIAFSHGPVGTEVVDCDPGATLVLTCSDVFGNSGGDYVGCLAGQSGIEGNFSADPLYCSATNLALDAYSPCAPDNTPSECGLVGALPVGCGVVSVPVAEAPRVGSYVRIAPNPLAGAGLLVWDDTMGGARTVRLYNLAGRLVLRRDLGTFGPGRHEVPWGDVVRSDALAAGVYFLRLDPNEGTIPPVRVVVTR